MIEITQAPQGSVLVKQAFPVAGTASTSDVGRPLMLLIDNQFQAAGPVVAVDGSWRFQFLFQQTGDRRLKVSIGNDSAEVVIRVVNTLPESQNRLRFVNPPSQARSGIGFILLGEAEGYADGTQLILRADQRFELARPQVFRGGWQAEIGFNQTGRRVIEIIGSGQDRAQFTLEIVPAPAKLRFTNVLQRAQTGQTFVVAGEAEGYANGTQLLLRTDFDYELARPQVQAGKWQAPVVFRNAGRRLLEVMGTGQEKATTTIDIIAAPTTRPPRVGFTNPPSQVPTGRAIDLSGTAENYNDGDQLVLRADQKIELARPRVQQGRWQATTLFNQPGKRLIEIIGSDQDKAQTILNVVAPEGEFTIFPRNSWTNSPTPTDIPTLNPVRITVHHTALSAAPAVNASQVQEITRMRLIWNSHVNGNGWSDIGYHFIVMPSGRVYEARSERRRGAHDVINDGLGIAFDGIYSSQTISQQQFTAAVNLCTRLCQRYSINDPTTPVSTATADFGTRNLPRILGHRDRVATECPGTEGGRTVRLSEIRQAVKARLG
jgi:hypothetical protein